MSITAQALKRTRFTLAAAVALFVAGAALLLDFPATEEPTVPTRVATVEAYLPGAPTERMERLVARPIEDRVREIAEVQHVEAIVRPGSVFLYVTLYDATAPARLPQVWQRLRVKAAEAERALPEGTEGPIVNDDFGRVSVLTLALTGSGYSAGQLQDWARTAQTRLQSVDGVAQASLHGVREERIYVDLSLPELAAAGLTVDGVASALARRNIVAAAGEIESGGRMIALQPTGDLPDVAALAAVPVALPEGGAVPLSSLGKVERRPQDPPVTAALYDGEPAVVIGFAMREGLNVESFVERLTARVAEVERGLPAGMRLHVVTDQSKVVSKELSKVGQIFLETVVVVLLVVVAFLGWKVGLITGTIVPLTVLGTLVVMRLLGIELHQISIAAIIIALGLFVDNGIVVVEDYQRRLAEGEDRAAAAEAAGRTLAAPLLISCLAIIIAFFPLVAGSSDTAEYMRSLAIVMAVTLLLSLFLALTVTPVLAARYSGSAHNEDEERGPIAKVRRWYGARVRFIVQRPLLWIGGLFSLLAGAVLLSSLIPSELLSLSARKQLQVAVDLDAGTSSRETYEVAQRLSRRLADKRRFPAVVGNVVYVGDGGPRFILGLNPPTPARHRAYAVVNIAPDADAQAVVEAMRSDLRAAFPTARVDPKRFSLGAFEAGTAVFRLTGPDRAALHRASRTLRDALRRAGASDVRDDAETSVPHIVLDIDHGRAAAAGVTPADVARSLDAAYSGQAATQIRNGDVLVPVLLRARDSERLSPERLAVMPVQGANGPVQLAQIAAIRVERQRSVLTRRNLEPAITVTARHSALTAQGLVDAVADDVAALGLPTGHRVELGGEIEESEEADAGLETYLPLALVGMAALFLWRFGSLRETAIIMVSIPFVFIGATLGLLVTGQPMSYTATLGLLALAGIIVNNAVLLIERLHEERASGLDLLDAIAAAATVRLRPIIMTKLVCVLGLVPLFAFGGDLWRPMAAAMIGGLLLGTLITLVLIPALYAFLFGRIGRGQRASVRQLEHAL